MMVFDTHAHVLSPDREAYPYGPLRGGAVAPVSPMDFPVEELVAQMDACGIAHACLVQRATLYGYDNRYALDAAAAYPGRLAPVLVLDAQDPASCSQLRELTSEHTLAGLRIVAPTLTKDDTEWLAGDQARAFWRQAVDLGLSVAVILYRLNHSAGLAALRDIVREFRDIPILIDHVGLPHPSTPEKKWAEANGHNYAIPADADFGIGELLAPFEELEHVHFKATDINFDRLADAGLDAARFVWALAGRFGAERLLWGSDVGQSPAPYAEKVERLQAAVVSLDAAEQEALLSGNALRIYGHALAKVAA
jgi:predicted TIM-barrel fold metal-dependent hydrolase